MNPSSLPNGLSRNVVKVFLSYLTACVIGVGPARGSDFYKAEYGDLPSHLTPIVPFEHDQKVTRHLFVTSGELGRMLVQPSFDPEYCLSVRAEIPAAAIQKQGEISIVPDEGKDFFITITTASTNLSFAMSREAVEGEAGNVKITRLDKQISVELAVAIQRVWAKALLLTRYPRYPAASSYVLDPTTYRFSVWVRDFGNVYGETLGAEGLSHKLTEVGLDLIEFARQDPREKTGTESQLTKRLKTLEASIPKPAR